MEELVEMQQKPQTWRALLGQIVEDTQMKQHILKTVRIHQLTLTRWINNEVKPRDSSMLLLLKAIPQTFHESFFALILVDFPQFASAQENMSVPHELVPPSEFYARVLSAYANTLEALYPQTMYDLILAQALEHLDPERQGMSVSIVRCVPPFRGTKVRSLREVEGKGTLPWSRDLKEKTIFLGSEALAGAALTTCRLVYIQSPEESQLQFPAHWVEHEQSAAAYPLLRKMKVAGCLLVSSTLPFYFTKTHLTLVEYYANLMALAFEPRDFFEITDIELKLMPPYKMQIPLFHDFNRRVMQKLTGAAALGQYIHLIEAQGIVWREIEEELLHLSWYLPT